MITALAPVPLDSAALDALDRHGVPEEYREAVVALARQPEVTRALLAILARLDLDVLAAELDGRDLACGGGCGTSLPAAAMKPSPGPTRAMLCDACHAAEARREQRRLARRGIASALSRARAASAPATLTDHEWAEALVQFKGCAFCGGQWYVVAHLLPVPLGGGTTAANCVPACYECASRKGDATLDAFERAEGRKFPKVREWAKGRR